ncbi:MAG: HupE/UreJ family protein [Planctomycetes bacterium]|nr:HupE/UreJ family protein [Planctomycetota bacterium]
MISGLCSGLVLLYPAVAQAHLVNTQFGPFYDGLCHPFVTPTDLMMVLALSLLAGAAGPAAGRTALLSLTASWLVGMLLGQMEWSRPFTVPVSVAAGATLLVAVLVAARLRCSPAIIGVFSSVIGLGWGLTNGGEFRALTDGPLVLAGNVACVFMVTAWVTSLAVKCSHGWQQIVVRVAASWLVAINLLVLGWELRQRLAG